MIVISICFYEFFIKDAKFLNVFWLFVIPPQEPTSEYAQPRVSPYRLAAHLTSAFVIYCGLFWTALSVVMPEPPAESVAWVHGAAKVRRLALPVGILVGITAISGAFVAGNDAVCIFLVLSIFTIIPVQPFWGFSSEANNDELFFAFEIHRVMHLIRFL